MIAASVQDAQGNSSCDGLHAALPNVAAQDSAGTLVPVTQMVVLAALLHKAECGLGQSIGSHVVFCAKFLRPASNCPCSHCANTRTRMSNCKQGVEMQQTGYQSGLCRSAGSASALMWTAAVCECSCGSDVRTRQITAGPRETCISVLEQDSSGAAQTIVQ